MPGLWRNNAATPEGKFPVVLRRDGRPVEERFFVLLLKDPGAAAALDAYANAHEYRATGDPEFVADVRRLAVEAQEVAKESAERAMRGDDRASDPAAPPHRTEDPGTLAWARSIGCPGT